MKLNDLFSKAPDKLIYVRCIVCFKTFSLTSNYKNELCEHLLEKFREFDDLGRLPKITE